MAEDDAMMSEDARPLRVLRFQEFTSSSGLADLIEQVEGFIDRAGDEDADPPKPETEEARLHSWQYQVEGGTHNLVLIYTE